MPRTLVLSGLREYDLGNGVVIVDNRSKAEASCSPEDVLGPHSPLGL
jgi:hypothetical protein